VVTDKKDFKNTFILNPENTFIWNQQELVKFLIDHRDRYITIDTDCEGVCLSTTGVYQLLENIGCEYVNIRTNNLLEKHNKYRVYHFNPFIFFEIDHSNYEMYHVWNKKHVFGCVYNRPLWHRIGLAAELQSSYNSLVHVRANPTNKDCRMAFEIDLLFEHCPSSFKKFAQVVDTWPNAVDTVDTTSLYKMFTTQYTDSTAMRYPEFLIDIVAETWITGRTFFPTEKTIRPMLLKKPIIVMGSQHSLAYLRQMGFKTFSDFWSEDYDGYHDSDRYVKILELIHRLSQLTHSELEQMYLDMQPILDHNFELLKTQTYNKIITEITNE
jgi:hypothetical protein